MARQRMFSVKEVRKIRKRVNDGEKIGTIARELGVGYNTIKFMVDGKTYADVS